MPFKSAKQRRYLYSQKPEVAKKFAMDSAKKGKMLKLRKGGPQDRGDEKNKTGAYAPGATQAVDKSTKQQTTNHNINTGRSGNVNTVTTTNTSTRGDTPKTKRNFVQTIGYNVKEKTKDILGINKKDKTKNLNDLAITSREIGLQNQYTKDAKQRDLDTARDSKKAFQTNATYKSDRRINKMIPGSTKMLATVAKKPLGKNAARNAKFFDDYVLGGKNKGVMTGTKKNSIYSKSGMTQEKFATLSQDKKAQMMTDYSKKRQSGEIDAYGRPKVGGDGDGGNSGIKPIVPVITPVKKVIKPEDKSKTFFGGFKAYKKGKMIKAKGGGGFAAMIAAGGPKIQQAFENVISRNLKNQTDPVRRNKFMEYGSVPINELESKVKQMRASNKKTKKPEDKSKTFFGGFKAYAKKGKMISTQNKVNGVVTALKKASKLHAGQAKTLSKLKLNKGGGVPYGPPPLRGPNPQVPPVKFSRGGGSALRGTKFKGIF